MHKGKAEGGLLIAPSRQTTSGRTIGVARVARGEGDPVGRARSRQQRPMISISARLITGVVAASLEREATLLRAIHSARVADRDAGRVRAASTIREGHFVNRTAHIAPPRFRRVAAALAIDAVPRRSGSGIESEPAAIARPTACHVRPFPSRASRRSAAAVEVDRHGCVKVRAFVIGRGPGSASRAGPAGGARRP